MNFQWPFVHRTRFEALQKEHEALKKAHEDFVDLATKLADAKMSTPEPEEKVIPSRITIRDVKAAAAKARNNR